MDEVSLILCPRGKHARWVGHWLELLREHPAFAGARIGIAHLGDTGRESHDVHVEAVMRISLDGGEQAMRAILERITTPYLALISPVRPRQAVLANLERDLRLAREDLANTGASPARPVLLPHRLTPSDLVTQYVNDRWQAPATHLAQVVLSACKVQLEWLQPEDDGLKVGLSVLLPGEAFKQQPPWAFQALLVGSSGVASRSEPALLQQTVGATGERRWEALVARVGLATVDPGDYHIALTLAEGSPEPRFEPHAKPSTGALAGARTVRLAPSTEGIRGLRYLLTTSAKGGAARLRLRETDARSSLKWWAHLVREDIRYALGKQENRSMRGLRLLRLITVPLFCWRQIWILGERADEAEDNGLRLFEHLRGTRHRRRAYYVLLPDSPAYARVSRLGHVVPHSSLRHRLLMLHGDVLANAQSLHHMVPKEWDLRTYYRDIAWRVGAVRVFLQHGVHLNPGAVHRGRTGYDVFLTSAARESAALRAASGYDEQIAEVGLPRFDHLVPTPRSRLILAMFTWRRYLPSRLRGTDQGQDEFAGSAYERFITSMLGSADLHSLLDHYDYRLVLVPHYNVVGQFAGTRTGGERIAVTPAQGAELSELIRRCDALITDYSSVQFDVAYIGTPVIYAQFDRAEYDERHAGPSWFDYDRDGFGPVAFTLSDTLGHLESLLSSGCRNQEQYLRRADRIFTHRDQRNSARAAAAIEAAVHRARR